MTRRDEYNHEIFLEIIDRLADCGYIKPLLDRGRAEGRPYPSYFTFRVNWLMKNDGKNGEMYDDARREYGDKLAYETIAFADNRTDSPMHNANSLKSRQWMAERLNRKVWGNKVDVNHGGQRDNPLTQLIQQVSGSALLPVDAVIYGDPPLETEEE